MGPSNHDIYDTARRHYHDNPSEASSVSSSPDHMIQITSDEFGEHPSTRPAWFYSLLGRSPLLFARGFKPVIQWVKGPQPPRIYKIRPRFEHVQTAPIRYLDRYLPKRKQKIWAMILFYVIWAITFIAVLHKSAFASELGSYGSPLRLWCGASFWNDGNKCGMNGDNCRPFDNSTFAFRCPANCRSVHLANAHAVGYQEVIYRSLVVGGPTDAQGSVGSTIYRGDSFICAAAIHSGLVNNKQGGCGVVSLIGEKTSYPSLQAHGIDSIGFDSSFPLSFTFIEGTASDCKDLRWPLLAVSVIFTSILSIFTTSPAVFFSSIFVALFFHVSLASDPPNLGPATDYYSIISIALGRFLPAAFVMVVIYRFCVRRQLEGLTAQFEKTALWLGAAWVGALCNYTFDKIPISRLTPHDIKQQPGAIPALIAIVLVILLIALGQAWALRVEGRMPRYLALYLTMGVSLLLLVAVPHMNLRIHHYILALLLLPGTAIQNRPSLLYQGLLIGLFINGVARWGFDSILQTPAQLMGDGKLGSLLPRIAPPMVGAENITFTWAYPLAMYDGISILVNDVERFRAYQDFGADAFTWMRHRAGQRDYFRFAYMSGSDVGDYTRAGIWETDGSWTEMQPGPS